MVATTYKEKLNRQFRNYVMRLLLLTCLFLGILFLLYALGLNVYRNQKNGRWLLKTVEEGYTQYTTFLQEEQAQETFNNCIEGKVSPKYVAYYCNTFDLSTDFSCDWVLLDQTGTLVFSNRDDTYLGTHMLYFTRLLQRNVTKEDIYYTTYTFHGNSQYVMTAPVMTEDGKYRGTISCYINGKALEKVMQQNQFDGIVCDKDGRAIIASNWNMLDELHCFRLQQDSHSFTFQNHHFNAYRIDSDQYDITIYTLLRATDNVMPYNLLVLLNAGLIFVALLLSGKRFARHVAEINSTSLELLHSEINTVQHGNGTERIHIKSGDEFEDIAGHINAMLDQLQALSNRNLELGKLNSQMERLQLEAQFDPHFLYNTLESIRYGIRFGDQNSDGIILKLTALLRYSIGSNSDTVTLEEDLRHLQDYLDIICYRFEGRFQYQMDIPTECKTLLCPRLCLQPIVENSVKYSLPYSHNLTVTITGWTEDGNLYLQVKDNGIGMEPRLIQEMEALFAAPADIGSPHHGLRNIDRRLKLQFSHGSGITLLNQPGQGACVQLRIWQRGEENEV